MVIATTINHWIQTYKQIATREESANKSENHHKAQLAIRITIQVAMLTLAVPVLFLTQTVI